MQGLYRFFFRLSGPFPQLKGLMQKRHKYLLMKFSTLPRLSLLSLHNFLENLAFHIKSLRLFMDYQDINDVCYFLSSSQLSLHYPYYLFITLGRIQHFIQSHIVFALGPSIISVLYIQMFIVQKNSAQVNLKFTPTLTSTY